MFLSLEHFYFCHCLAFRYSYFEFLIENLGFRSSTKYRWNGYDVLLCLPVWIIENKPFDPSSVRRYELLL